MQQAAAYVRTLRLSRCVLAPSTACHDILAHWALNRDAGCQLSLTWPAAASA
jgi:hypothetical protein